MGGGGGGGFAGIVEHYDKQDTHRHRKDMFTQIFVLICAKCMFIYTEYIYINLSAELVERCSIYFL